MRSLLAVPFVAAAVVGIATVSASAADDDPTADDEVELSSEELLAEGAQLFAAQCAGCHGDDGSGVEDRGPSLKDEGRASADFVLRTGRMPLAAPNIQARSGPVRYSEQEIQALVEFVGTIGSGPDTPEVEIDGADIANGGYLYRLNCAACHSATGAGTAIGGGRRAPSMRSVSPTEIGEAIVVGPGAMPVFSSLEAQEIDDIAAYIVELQEEGTTDATKFGGAGPAAEGLAAWLLALIPLAAFTRWIGSPKEGRDRPLDENANEPAEPAAEAAS
jgi:ubiquinol-cytochrome c reductase cytochrome c subunit